MSSSGQVLQRVHMGRQQKTTATAAIAGVKVKITLAAAAATAAGRRIFLQNVKGKNVDVCDPGAENRAEAGDAIGAAVGVGVGAGAGVGVGAAAVASVAVGGSGVVPALGFVKPSSSELSFLDKTPQQQQQQQQQQTTTCQWGANLELQVAFLNAADTYVL